MTTAAGVLRLLSEKVGEFVSGEDAAARLGVSRMAVAKAVSKLKNLGYVIDSGTGQGHRLTADADILSQTSLEAFLPDGFCGQWYASTDSTNIAAKAAPLYTVAAASVQTAGSGRRKRLFFSGEGGAYFSVKIPVGFSPECAPLVTLASGVAVCQALETYGVSAQVKYPNDCLADGRKICGILTECMMDADCIIWAVIGIGVNVTNTFPEELKTKAVALSEIMSAPPTRVRVIGDVVQKLCGLLKDKNLLYGEYKRFDALIGMRLLLIGDDSQTEADYAGIDGNGYLIADLGGEKKRIVGGEVSIRQA